MNHIQAMHNTIDKTPQYRVTATVTIDTWGDAPDHAEMLVGTELERKGYRLLTVEAEKL